MDLPDIDTLWDFDNPAASELRFDKVVTQAYATGDHRYEVEAMTQLARSLGMQSKFNAAQSVLNDANRKLEPDMNRAAIRWQLEQGRVFNSGGDATRSIKHFERALKLAEEFHAEYLAIDAAHMLGIVCDPDTAIEWHVQAMAMAEQASDPQARTWLGPLYNNLAWTYSDQGDLAAALALFTKDIAFRESIDHPFEASIALWSKAKTLRLMGEVDAALEIQRSLVDHPLRMGKPAEGYTHEEIGECLLLLDRAEDAKAHFAIAHERLLGDDWLVANEPNRLARLLTLST